MPEGFSDARTWTKQRFLGLGCFPSKNDRLDLVFALVGDTPLEYQQPLVAFLLATPLNRFRFA